MALVDKIAALATRVGAHMKALQDLATNTATLSQAAGTAAAEALQKANATAASHDAFQTALADYQNELIRWTDRTTKLELWAAQNFGYQIPTDDA